MKRLNSRMTYFSKVGFPLIWYGFLSFFIVAAQFEAEGMFERTMFFVVPIFMAVIGYMVMKQSFLSLINEVYRQGDTLIFKNGSEQVRISVRDIINAHYYTMSQPPQCVLRLRYETKFGKELTFMPKIGGKIFSYNADVEQLVDDVDRQNMRSR